MRTALMMPPGKRSAALLLASVALITGCATRILPPLPPQPQVDLARYSGTWFVIGAIPLDLEKDAYDPVESYHLRSDGSVDVVFQYRRKDYTGELITHTGSATVEPGSGNSVWGIRFLWPFRSEYRIGYLEPDYSAAMITRSARDHAWILARRPHMDMARIERYKARMRAMGYDTSAFLVFPQNGDKP